MVLYSIPDIRLFWSTDPRFGTQFTPGKISTFQPFSKYPICYKDLSFWKSDKFHENDLCDVIRDVASDLVEDILLVSFFDHLSVRGTHKLGFYRLIPLPTLKPAKQVCAIDSTTDQWNGMYCINH
jgi:phenylalanyl-tRNA synthetase beta subunit